MKKLNLLFLFVLAAGAFTSVRADEIVAKCREPQYMGFDEPIDSNGNATLVWHDLELVFQIKKIKEDNREKFVVVDENNIAYADNLDSPHRPLRKLNSGGVEYEALDKEYLEQIKDLYDTGETDGLPYGFDFSKVKSGYRVILDAKGQREDANGIVINFLKDENDIIVGKMGTIGWGPLRCKDI